MVCEVVDFYERWVNGNELRVVEMAAGRSPARAPERCREAPGDGRETIALRLAPYEGGAALPRLDAAALAPIAHVLVHGSMATNDACAFSDVDVAVIVDDVGVYDGNAHRRAVGELRTLLRAVFGHDALMHHGLMFFPASGLRAYDQRFLPLDTLRCARVLHGPSELRLQPADAPEGHFRQALRRSAESLRRHMARRDFFEDDYRLKNVIAGSLLMPARVLSAQGTHVYKRDSFDLARGLFTAAQWEFVARCEALRAMWVRPQPPLLHRYAPARSHPRLRQIAGARMAPRLNVRRLSRTMMDGLVNSAATFLDRVETLS